MAASLGARPHAVYYTLHYTILYYTTTSLEVHIANLSHILVEIWETPYLKYRILHSLQNDNGQTLFLDGILMDKIVKYDEK